MENQIVSSPELKIIVRDHIVTYDGNWKVLLGHRHDFDDWEPIGGKLKPNEFSEKPHELFRALGREKDEELGGIYKTGEPHYLGYGTAQATKGPNIKFYSFLEDLISGAPVNKNGSFDRIEFIPIKLLCDIPLCPDLKLTSQVLDSLVEIALIYEDTRLTDTLNRISPKYHKFTVRALEPKVIGPDHRARRENTVRTFPPRRPRIKYVKSTQNTLPPKANVITTSS